jgi:hypothetical protein
VLILVTGYIKYVFWIITQTAINLAAYKPAQIILILTLPSIFNPQMKNG